MSLPDNKFAVAGRELRLFSYVSADEGPLQSGWEKAEKIACAMSKTRGPIFQAIAVLFLVAAFVIGRWLIVDQTALGSFAQCLPIALIASLFLSRIFAIAATVGALAITAILYFDEFKVSVEDDKGGAIAITLAVFSVGFIAAAGAILRDTIVLISTKLHSQSNATQSHRPNLESKEALASEHISELADCDGAKFRWKLASTYRRKISTPDLIFEGNVEKVRLAHHLVPQTLIPLNRHNNLKIRMPHAVIHRENVTPFMRTLQELGEASARFGALSNPEYEAVVTGSITSEGLHLVWREACCTRDMRLFLMGSDAFVSQSTSDPSHNDTEVDGFSCHLLVPGAKPGETRGSRTFR